VAVRASKLALARAAALLGTDQKAARGYMRRVQALARTPIPYTTIVAAMEETGTDVDAVAARAVELAGEDEPGADESASGNQS
jgi:hypothetical protein